jgi:uncharacterized protein (DUF433 family)
MHLAGYKHDSAPPRWQNGPSRPSVPAYAQSAFWLMLGHDQEADVMGGTAVFHWTRIPVQTLFDHLEAGETIDDFLEGFPSATREQVIAFLEEAKDRVIEAAS